jgi:hypothetical protein
MWNNEHIIRELVDMFSLFILYVVVKDNNNLSFQLGKYINLALWFFSFHFFFVFLYFTILFSSFLILCFV